MKDGAAKLSSPLAILLTHVSTIENGQVNGNEVNGFQIKKKMKHKRLTIADQ